MKLDLRKENKIELYDGRYLYLHKERGAWVYGVNGTSLHYSTDGNKQEIIKSVNELFNQYQIKLEN